MHLVVGDPIVNIVNNDFYQSDKITVTGNEKYNVQNLWEFKPSFDGESFRLSDDSPLKGKGTDKLDLGTLDYKIKN